MVGFGSKYDYFDFFDSLRGTAEAVPRGIQFVSTIT